MRWRLIDGVLTVSGEGAMADYSLNDLPPWKELSFHTVVIESGVTQIGKYAFYCCTALKDLTIPDSVTSIGNYAFSFCSALTSLHIPASMTSFGTGVFDYCTNLAYLCSSVEDGAAAAYCKARTISPSGSAMP